jgi:hypothetical protein
VLREQGDWVRQVYSGDDLRIYEVQDTQPPAWGVGDVVVAADTEAAIASIAGDGFDPDRSVAIARSDLPAGLSQSVGGAFNVFDIHYEPGDIRASADFTANGWVAFSTRYDGGWTAEVDGEDVSPVRANGVLMAVPVPAGEHSVVLRFQPSEVTWGRRISIAAAVLTVFAVAGYVVYRRRDRNAL